MEYVLVPTGVGLSVVVPLAATIALIWATIAKGERKRGVATIALCLWCVVAGSAFSGSLWSWMSSTNFAFLAGQTIGSAPGSPPIDLERASMGMLKFFIRLDQFLRRFFHAFTLIPLIFAIEVYRKSLRPPLEKAKLPIADDEFSAGTW